MTYNKKYNTGIRICKTFFELSKRDLTVNELKKIFENEYGNTFSSELFYKYINTIRASGFLFEKENNIFKFVKIPPYLNLNDKEILGLSLISKFNFSSPVQNSLQNFFLSLEKHLTFDTAEALRKIKYIKTDSIKNRDIFKKLQMYLNDLVMLKIELTNGDFHTGIPVSLDEISGKMIFKIYESSKFYDIDAEKIKNIEQLRKRTNPFNYKSSICFLLKGTLAKSYKLKEGEKIIERISEDRVVIKNTLEAENTLLKRLLRYGKFCVILTPVDTKLKMMKMIEETLALYQNKNIE